MSDPVKIPELIFVSVLVVDQKATGGLARKYRLSTGLSLREVARRMKISAVFLSDLERGRRNWKVTTMSKFLAAIQKVKKV